MNRESTFPNITEDEKNQMILRLVAELPVLRTKMGVSQDELATMLGISRQTYSSIETGKRKMMWSTFLLLVFVFYYNEKTHSMIEKEKLLPGKFIKGGNSIKKEGLISSFVSMENDDIKNHLDDQAIHAIETVIMVEYARCNDLSGEAVIKAFDGKYLRTVTDEDIRVSKALKNIKGSSPKEDNE